MVELFSLLIATLTYLGSITVVVVPERTVTAFDAAHQSVENPSSAYTAVAKARCIDGVPSIVLTPEALLTDTTVIHELLHAADCADDGAFNGSLDPTGCSEQPSDCAHSWVYWALRNPATAEARLRLLRP